MTTQINERIKIAGDFKSIYKWNGKTQKNKNRTLRLAVFLDYELVLFMLIILLLVSASTLLKISSVANNWANAGLMVLMTMSLSLRAPSAYIELLLKKHIEEIENIETEFDERLNLDFENIIIKLNNRQRNIYIIGIPSILIFIAAFLQVFDFNPYWNKFPVLVLAVSVYLLIRINHDVLRLKRNLKQVIAVV